MDIVDAFSQMLALAIWSGVYVAQHILLEAMSVAAVLAILLFASVFAYYKFRRSTRVDRGQAH